MSKDSLSHYGILGMHWGHKKSNSSDDLSTKKVKNLDKKKITTGMLIAGTVLTMAASVAVQVYVNKNLGTDGYRGGRGIPKGFKIP